MATWGVIWDLSLKICQGEQLRVPGAEARLGGRGPRPCPLPGLGTQPLPTCSPQRQEGSRCSSPVLKYH